MSCTAQNRLKRLVLRQVCLLALFVPLAQARGLIARISDIRALPPSEAKLALPVLIRGVVTMRDGTDLTVQDESAGIWVAVNIARGRKLLTDGGANLDDVREGMELEIAGITGPGDFAPILLPSSVRVLGMKALPPARQMVASRFLSGVEDSQRIEVRGVVQRVSRQASFCELFIDAVPGRLTVEVASSLVPDPESLIDAELRVCGVVGSYFNAQGGFISPRLISRMAGDLVIEKPAPSLADVPRVSLDRLFAFRPEPLGPHRQRVAGTVTFALPGQFFFLQEGNNAVRVASHTAVSLQAGDRVEALGFLDGTGINGGMTEATVWKTGSAEVPGAVLKDPEEVMRIYEKDIYLRGESRADDFDGRLIRFRARLLRVRASPDRRADWRQVTLEQGRLILGAILHTGDAKALDRLQPGSEVEVTGILKLDFSQAITGLDFQRRVISEVTLREAGDVTVVRAPSWWTSQRLLVLLGAGAALLGASMLWVLLLRQEVTRKMRIISENLRSEAVSGERNRVARDLHDTLEQQLAGIALQLDRAKKVLVMKPEVASMAMALASRMLRHTRLEARRSVWDLRSRVLELHGLAIALRTMAESVSSPDGPLVDVRAPDERLALPEGVEFQLLRVAQEALGNALKHARARHVVIALECTQKQLQLQISDDGVGFLQELSENSAQGHFGLLGMQERAIRIGARVSVTSSPGTGCVVTLDLPVRPISDLKPSAI